MSVGIPLSLSDIIHTHHRPAGRGACRVNWLKSETAVADKSRKHKWVKRVGDGVCVSGGGVGVRGWHLTEPNIMEK